MYISNYLWWDNDSESSSVSSEYADEINNFAKLKLEPIKRSTSYNSFFTEEKKDKEYKIISMTKLNNILFKIDDFNSKVNMHINNVKYYNQNNYRLILGIAGSLLFSMLTLRIINK